MEMSVRVPMDWTAERVVELKEGMKTAFTNYAISTPLKVRGEPVAHFEVFPAERAFTEDGDVRGLCDKGINDWWDGAILHLMKHLQSQFEGRGVMLYTVRDGTTYHLPMLDSCKAA